MKRPLFVLLIGLVLGELCGYLLYLTGVMIPASLLMAGLSFDRSAGKGKPFYCRGKGRQTGRKMFFLYRLVI